MTYFDIVEVPMPQTNSRHTEEIGYYPTTFGGQGKSHSTLTDCTGLFTALVGYINLHRYNLDFPVVYYVHLVKNDLLYV
jgi:hypothetical protein